MTVAVGTTIGLVCTFLVYWTVRRTTSRWSSGDQQAKRTREVGMQAVWYMASFMNSLIWTMAPTIMGKIFGGDTTDEFFNNKPLLVSYFIMSIFFPLQGFLNCIVYMRPRLQRWKALKPEQSWSWAFRQVLSGETVPTRKRRSSQLRASIGLDLSSNGFDAASHSPSTSEKPNDIVEVQSRADLMRMSQERNRNESIKRFIGNLENE